MADTQTYTPSIFSPVFKWVDTLNVQFNRPLDNRTIVRKKADLKALGTAVYGGMLVTVAEENKTYMLKPDIRNIENLTNDTWVGVQDPASYIQNMDNWVVASNTSRVVDYLHTSQINPTTDLNNIYCVIKGKQPTNPGDLSAVGWQDAGLYVVIPDGDSVKLHSLLSGGTIEGLAGKVDNLEAEVGDLKTIVNGENGLSGRVDSLDTRVGNLETIVNGTDDTDGLSERVDSLEAAVSDFTPIGEAGVDEIWGEIMNPSTEPTPTI